MEARLKAFHELLMNEPDETKRQAIRENFRKEADAKLKALQAYFSNLPKQS